MAKKLDLKTVLFALDTKNKKYYSNLSDEDKKQYAAYVLMRFMSSAPDQNGLHEYHLLATNDLVNQNFWDLSKHPELQHYLLTMVGLGRKQYHPWIAPPKKQIKDKVETLFRKVYPDLNELELNILYKQHTSDSIKSLCKNFGMTDSEVKEIVESYKKLTNR